MCERLLANPLIEELRGRARRMSVSARVGVVVFPGSCDERDALLARRARRRPRPSSLWHADRDLRGVDAVVVPGGFSYGDYLRAARSPASRR